MKYPIEPTQAQIEAAREAFWSVLNLGGVQDDALNSALTAAAEVGEPQITVKEAENRMLIHGNKVIAGTIERCAQVADHLNGWGNKATQQSGLAEHIAAAIRKLKDEV